MMEIEPVNSEEPLRTDADLLRWARFINHGVHPRRRTLWVLLLDADDVPRPVIIPIEDVPDLPDARGTARIAEALAVVLEEEAPEGSVVMMLERPGPPLRAQADHAWHTMLRWSMAEAGVRVRAVFLAAAGEVLAFALDDAA